MDQRQQSVVYSPVDRTRTLASDPRRARRERPKPLTQLDITAPKLRYLDDTSTDQDKDEESAPAAGPRVMFEKCTGPLESVDIPRSQAQKQRQRELASIKTFGAVDRDNYDQGGRRTAQDETLDEEEAERERNETTASLEEVYLCSCCGVTRPLDPAMKYMPFFRGTFMLFNFLAFAFGLANLSMGLWFRIDPKVYEIHKYIETQNFTYAGWIMLASGFLTCMMSLAGFAAAARQSICLLISYAVTMTLLTVALIGALVLLTVYGLGAHLERFMSKEIYEQIRRRTMGGGDLLLSDNDANQFIDFVQVKLRCCGARDFSDYQKLGVPIPTTCYTIASNYINAPGCGRALRELFDLRAGLAAGSTAAGVICQLVAVVFASLMVCSIYNWRANPRPASVATYASGASSPSHMSRTLSSRQMTFDQRSRRSSGSPHKMA